MEKTAELDDVLEDVGDILDNAENIVGNLMEVEAAKSKTDLVNKLSEARYVARSMLQQLDAAIAKANEVLK